MNKANSKQIFVNLKCTAVQGGERKFVLPNNN